MRKVLQSTQSIRVERPSYIFEPFLWLCQRIVKHFTFWCLIAALLAAEPLLAVYQPVGIVLRIQFGVLLLSSVLYIIQLVGMAANEWEKISALEAMSSKTRNVIMARSHLTLRKLWIFFTAEGEYMFEGILLVYGWVMLPYRPGLAALRCFRLFRVLWFYEVDVFRRMVMRYFSPVLGKAFIHRMLNVLKFAINAIKALSSEIGFIGNEEARGGLMLILLFFYSAYVIGVTMWIEGDAQFVNCGSAAQCWYTLLRLTFFDGNGFDFAYDLTYHNRALFALTMVYLVVTALGILNGLIGIFGSLVAGASLQAFDDTYNDDDNNNITDNNRPIASPHGISSDDNSNDDEGGARAINLGSSSKGSSKSHKAMATLTAENSKQAPENENDENDDNDIKPFSHLDDNVEEDDDPDVEVITQGQPKKMRSARQLMASVDGTAAPLPAHEIQRTLQHLFRGESSRFVTSQLSQQQQTNTNNAYSTTSPNQVHNSGAKASTSELRDLFHRRAQVTPRDVHDLEARDELVELSATTRNKPRNVDIFDANALRCMQSSFGSSANVHNHSSNQQQQIDQELHELHKIVRRQNESIAQLTDLLKELAKTSHKQHEHVLHLLGGQDQQQDQQRHHRNSHVDMAAGAASFLGAFSSPPGNVNHNKYHHEDHHADDKDET